MPTRARRRDLRSVLKNPAFAAAATFAFGFFALLLLWSLGRWPAERSLFDYRAATIGDGLFLPALACALTMSLRRLPPVAGETRRAAIAAVAGGVAGVALQAVWLLDSNPQLNWTLPEPGEFNAAGWYHAGFLVAAFSFFTALFVLVIERLRAAQPSKRNELATSPLTAVIVGTSLAMVGLVALDAESSSDTGATAATIAITGTAVVAGVISARLRLGQWLRLARPVIAVGVLFALALTVIASDGIGTDTALAIAASVVCLGLAVAIAEPVRADRKTALWLACLTAVGLLLLAAFAWSLTDRFPTWRLIGIGIASVAGPALVARLRRPPGAVDWRLVPAVAGPLFAITVAARPEQWGAFMSVFSLSGAILGGIVAASPSPALPLFWLRARFRKLIETEDLVRDRRLTATELDSAARTTWIGLYGVGLAIVVSATTSVLRYVDPDQQLDLSAIVDRVAIEAAALLIALLGIGGGAVASGCRRLRHHAGTVGSACMALAVLAWLAAPFLALDAQPHLWLSTSLIALVLGALVTESLLTNTELIHHLRPDRRIAAIAALAGAAVASQAWWLTSYGIWDGGAPLAPGAAAAMIALVVVGNVIFATAIGWALLAVRHFDRLTMESPEINVMQDQGLYGALTLIAGVLPLLLIQHIEESSVWVLLVSLGGLVISGFLALNLVRSVRWVMGNNFEHLGKEQTRPPWPILEDAALHRRESPQQLQELRLRIMGSHIVYWQTGMVYALLALALLSILITRGL